jgi:hypothetical protein
VHYDVDGPRVRLGLAWFAGAIAAFTLGLAAVVVYFGVAFAAAATHALRTWRARGHDVDPRLALLATAAVVVGAGFGSRPMGLAVIALAVVAVAVAARPSGGAGAVASRAGLLLQVTLPTAVAGGAVVLLADLEIWAAISLVVIASAYETGDFLIGSGAANSVEGPVAGSAAVVVTALAVAASGIAFESVTTAMIFGVAVAPLAFAGQMLASAMLPHARAHAPALRRVDSLLLAAPLWYVGLDRIVL